jgi:hypothetical protein
MAMGPRDGDIFWQQWLGDVILTQGHIPHTLGTEVTSAIGSPWVAHEWLFSTAYAWLGMHGVGFVALAALVACAIISLALTAWRSLDRGASIVATMVVVLITQVAMTPSLGFRVQIASWLFAALLFAILPHKRSRWLLVPLTLLWANVHASAVLAPIVIGICAFGRALDDHEEAAPLALLTLLTAAATVATPLGLALPAYAFSTLTSPAGPLTNEWQRPPTTFLALAMAFIVAIAFAPRGRIGSGERLVTLALFLMMEGASRHVSLFFLGAAPYAAAAFPLRSYALAPRSSLATALGVLVSVRNGVIHQPRVRQVSATTSNISGALHHGIAASASVLRRLRVVRATSGTSGRPGISRWESGPVPAPSLVRVQSSAIRKDVERCANAKWARYGSRLERGPASTADIKIRRVGSELCRPGLRGLSPLAASARHYDTLTTAFSGRA